MSEGRTISRLAAIGIGAACLLAPLVWWGRQLDTPPWAVRCTSSITTSTSTPSRRSNSAASDEDDIHRRRPGRLRLGVLHGAAWDPLLPRGASEPATTRAIPAAVRGDFSSFQTTRSCARAAALSPSDCRLRAVSSPDRA